MKRPVIIALAVTVAVIGAGSAAALIAHNKSRLSVSDTKMHESSKSSRSDMHHDTMMKAGAYIDYASYHSYMSKYDGGAVVLFFDSVSDKASQMLDRDITMHESKIPEGTTIVKVNYGSAARLKQMYNVAAPDTLVKIDVYGNKLKQWDNATTLAGLLKDTQA
jgi:hypothetical protein